MATQAADERPRLRDFLERLPKDAVVCEVGGGSSRQPRATWFIDVIPFERREEPRESDLVTEEQWIEHNICRSPWPVPDDRFDFTICSHTWRASA